MMKSIIHIDSYSLYVTVTMAVS